MHQVGLVGAGYIADIHLYWLRRLPGVEVVGIADVDGDRATAFARRHGITHVATSVEELVSQADPFAIHVLTPPSTHAQVANEALEAGRHVYVEKPMAVSTKDARRMLETAKRHRVTLCVGHNERFDPLVLRAKGLLATGALGELHTVESHRTEPLGTPPDPGTARCHPRWLFRSPLNAFWDLAPHLLYQQSEEGQALGSISAVARRSWRANDACVGHWHITSDWGNLVGISSLSVDNGPQVNQLVLRGNLGVVRVDILNQYLIIEHSSSAPKSLERARLGLTTGWQHIAGTAATAMRFVARRWRPYPGIGGLIGRFYDSLRNHTPCPVPAREGLQIVSLMERCVELGMAGEGAV